MSHDQLSLGSRFPVSPGPRTRGVAPSPVAQLAPQQTASAFQPDVFTPSASRPSAAPGTIDMSALAEQIKTLREQLVQIQSQLDAILQQVEPATHADDQLLAGDPNGTDGGLDGTVDHTQMAMDTESLKAEFTETDQDGSGDLNFQEIVVHEEGDEAKAQLHFTDADRNQDQIVDREEWVWHHQNSPLHTGANKQEPVLNGQQ